MMSLQKGGLPSDSQRGLDQGPLWATITIAVHRSLQASRTPGGTFSLHLPSQLPFPVGSVRGVQPKSL